MSLVRLAAALALAWLLLASCATGSGSGFAREASRERAAKNEQNSPSDRSKDSPTPAGRPSSPAASASPSTPAATEAPAPPPRPVITIVATPPQARISLNGSFIGTQSASFDSGGLGQQVTVRVEATSYRPQTLTLSLWGQTDTIAVDLVPITGILNVTGSQLEQTAITVDGQRLKPGANRVLIGTHTVQADRFGFVGQRRTVDLAEDQTTEVAFDLLPAPFDLTDLKSDHPEGFNPESAAIAATLGLSFQATGPGHALLVLTDRVGIERGRWDFLALTTWGQRAEWSGRFGGEALDDGAYELTLTGGADPGVDTVRRSATVRIDRSFVDKDRPSLGPAAGLLWVPTAEVLSPGTLELSALGIGHREGDLLHAPVSMAARFSPARDWELLAQLSARLWSDSYLNSGYATFSVKHRLETSSPSFRSAWVLAATAGTWLEGDAGVPPTDFLTTFPGVKALLPISWSWGRFTLLLAPELDFSYWSPATAYTLPTADEGPKAWGYGRAGLVFDLGSVSLAISGAARTDTFDRGVGLLAPAHLGLEGHATLPGTPLTLGGYLSVSAYSTVDYAWYGGVGFSVLLPPALTLDLASQLDNSP